MENLVEQKVAEIIEQQNAKRKEMLEFENYEQKELEKERELFVAFDSKLRKEIIEPYMKEFGEKINTLGLFVTADIHDLPTKYDVYKNKVTFCITRGGYNIQKNCWKVHFIPYYPISHIIPEYAKNEVVIMALDNGYDRDVQIEQRVDYLDFSIDSIELFLVKYIEMLSKLKE